MNLFKTVKESVTVKQAAALYGLPVTSTWMVRCPFHEDHTPSMKLNDNLLLLLRLRRPPAMSSTLPPSCLASAASRRPGSWPRDFGTQPGQASIGCSRSAQASRCQAPAGRSASADGRIPPQYPGQRGGCMKNKKYWPSSNDTGLAGRRLPDQRICFL